MLKLVACTGEVVVDNSHMHGRSGCCHWSHAWEEWMLTLITYMGEIVVDTGHMHGRSGC